MQVSIVAMEVVKVVRALPKSASVTSCGTIKMGRVRTRGSLCFLVPPSRFPDLIPNMVAAWSRVRSSSSHLFSSSFPPPSFPDNFLQAPKVPV